MTTKKWHMFWISKRIQAEDPSLNKQQVEILAAKAYFDMKHNTAGKITLIYSEKKSNVKPLIY